MLKAVDSLLNMGVDFENMSKIFLPLVAALCGKTAVAQRLVQQLLDSRDLQKNIHRKCFHISVTILRYTQSLCLSTVEQVFSPDWLKVR